MQESVMLAISLTAIVILSVFTTVFGILCFFGIQGVHSKLEILAIKLNSIQKNNESIQNAMEASMDGISALIDHATHPHMKTNKINHFTTEDGKIQSDNLQDFLKQLENSDEYKDIADDIKKQLERELENDEYLDGLDDLDDLDEDDRPQF